MQAELEAIEASKKIFKKAVEDNVLTSDGLPRLRPSLMLRKENAKSKKSKQQQTADRLASIGTGAINTTALQVSLAEGPLDRGGSSN